MYEFTKTHKYFKQLAMVVKSVSKENVRYGINQILVDDKNIVATDGKRLACLKTTLGLPAGRYVCVKNTKTMIQLVPVEVYGNWPKYEYILSEPPKEDEKQQVASGVDVEALSITAYKIAQHKTAANIEYLRDYMACDSFYVSEPDRPIQFYAEDFHAIIMPITVE